MRRTPQDLGERAKRILDDDLHKSSFEEVRNMIIKQLEETHVEPNTEEYVLEMVRRLQSLKGVKRWLESRIQYGHLKEADFKPREVAK